MKRLNSGASMVEDDRRDDADSLDKRSFALLVFSISALLGVLISFLVTRRDRLTSTIRRLFGQEGPGDGSNLTRYSSEIPPALPSEAGASIPSAMPSSNPASRAGRLTEVPGGAAQVPSRVTWSKPTRYIMGVFLFLAVLVILFIVRSTIPLVVAAALLALFIDPLIGFLIRRFHMKKVLAVGITYLLVVALLLLVPLLAIPSLVNAVNFVMDIDIPMAVERLNQVIQSISEAAGTNPILAAFVIPLLDSLAQTINNWTSGIPGMAPTINLTAEDVASRFGDAMGALSRFLGPTLSFLASLFIILLLSIQMTLTSDTMQNWSADLIPPGYGPELSMMIQKIRRAWVGFLRGQMSLMLIIGVVTWLGGLILGLPQALFLGVIAGVLELIPNVGPTLAAIPAVVLALLFGSSHLAVSNLVFALIVVGFYVLVQLIENQYLVPNIMGDAVDLPPLVVLIGTIAGAGAFGIMGALLATPVIATGNLVFRYVYSKILENPPAPPPVEVKPGFIDTVRGYFARLRKKN